MAIDSLKLIRHLDRFKTHEPITADVFITNYCNNKCPYCTYRRWELEPGARYMHFEDFVKYTQRLLWFGVKGIILTGGGEPTLNPDFNKITEYLEKNEIDYGINTNFCEYRYFRPNYLKVSLDGYDRESYIKKRGVDRYDDVIANIKKYAENKDKSKTNLGVQMVVTDINDIEPFYNSVKDIDLDYIVFRPVESTNRCYYSDTDLKTFVPIFIKYLNSFKRKDDRIVVNSKWGQLDQRFKTCVANWAQIALDECGNVIYCCHKPYEIVGHIMDDDIMEKREAFKTNMCTCDVPCRLTASNMLVEYAEQRTKDDCFI